MEWIAFLYVAAVFSLNLYGRYGERNLGNTILRSIYHLKSSVFLLNYVYNNENIIFKIVIISFFFVNFASIHKCYQ